VTKRSRAVAPPRRVHLHFCKVRTRNTTLTTPTKSRMHDGWWVQVISQDVPALWSVLGKQTVKTCSLCYCNQRCVGYFIDFGGLDASTPDPRKPAESAHALKNLQICSMEALRGVKIDVGWRFSYGRLLKLPPGSGNFGVVVGGTPRSRV